MAYKLVTRTGRNFYEVTSIMQNAIRHGDYDVAGYAMWEMLPQFNSYLRKRLLIISAEDLFGVITKEIEELCRIGDEEALSKALSLMCRAKKNRDADFVVCNLMYQHDNTERSTQELSKLLTTAIRRFNVEEAGNLAGELFHRSRKMFWNTILTVTEVYYPYLLDEVNSLARCNELMTNPAEETIFGAKAIVLMWTKREPVELLLGHEGMSLYELLPYDSIEIIKPLDLCPKIRGLFPDQYYNWHTTHGKYRLMRDTVHAIENNQRLLYPLEENLFDDCSWNIDLSACLMRWNPHHRQIPYDDGKIKVGVKYGAKE